MFKCSELSLRSSGGEVCAARRAVRLGRSGRALRKLSGDSKGVVLGPGFAGLGLLAFFQAIAFAVHLEDVDIMGEPIE